MINEQDIFDIVAAQAKADPASLTGETKLTELNLQSIDVVELVFAIEEKFDIEIPFSPSEQTTAGISFQTVGEIVAGVSKLVAEQHPAA